MPRIAIVGLTCSTFLVLLSSSAVPQEPARARADAGLVREVMHLGRAPLAAFLADVVGALQRARTPIRVTSDTR
jgi:hypothetical protein